ncbi:cryptochrome/photolyase family protein [Naumannella halotolerans]|uniref:Deoxyribodipyrimidine photo-lyase n=1 Tax=Naumannella halotolerans TaxID=993414 RepID=A0A4V3EMU1_9ACTN|nr:deoxyribodipyrimidine photo-lyase [Naumannella halotolerans]TDT31318.1 deoxyribodipyrimidine photo-lyase [Naumannella halotolerans]
MTGPALLWFRRDLRLDDHPALLQAAESATVLPVFVLDPRLLEHAGPVRTHCLFDALDHLRRATDNALVVRTGDPVQVLGELVAEVGAGSIHLSTETTPFGRRRDRQVRAGLGDDLAWVETGSPYAVTPGRILNGSGAPYQVFTPFRRAWADHGWRGPAGSAEVRWCRQVDDPGPIPTSPLRGEDQDEELAARIGPCSEEAGRKLLADFLDSGIGNYDQNRDRADLRGTSELSMHLKYGTIHPRTILHALSEHRGDAPDVDRFSAEIAWREFYADVLFHNPRSAWGDLKPALSTMPYDEPDERLLAWQEGRTGFPFVDAAMRQLVATGWMHNRARMVTASFLCKDLHLWWPHGARHFLRHLRDGDIASNNHGWQWVAGTGTDASPYFRVFNPITQGKKFDPDGTYVRRWVPELAHLRGARVHEPWKAEDGYARGYPEPIIDHGEERAEALSRYEAARR